MSAEECEAEIKSIKQSGDYPFGVNFHSFQKDVDKIVDMCIDYKVAAISYGRAPSAKVIDRVKAAGIKCVPTIGAGKHAPKAVEMGADVLVCQGQEGGGHTGYTPTWLLLAQVLDSLQHLKLTRHNRSYHRCQHTAMFHQSASLSNHIDCFP